MAEPLHNHQAAAAGWDQLLVSAGGDEPERWGAQTQTVVHISEGQ